MNINNTAVDVELRADAATIGVFPPIATLVPHSDTMLLLDSVIAADAESLTATRTIRTDCLFFDANVGGIGSWVGIEYMAQAIAAHSGFGASLHGGKPKLGFLLGARSYTAHEPLFALGALLHIHVQCQLVSDNGLGSYQCHITVADKTVASATVTVFQPDDASQILSGSL